ncbi:hypothetical protein [Paraburkholderia sp. SIMBA_054]|uniref:hypothetical protein n=1 Tax=Paraburkholderia sp. SIMBA_054 TaxID=3085795 RepID=UPI003979755B
MDIFYYWKDFASDIAEGRIGTLGANTDKLVELQARLPRKVWTFITPKGMKGKLKVIGSMWITDERPANFVPKWRHNLFYDAASPKSVLFTDSGRPEKIEEVSSYLNNRFNQAFRSNFQGEKGLHTMEADVVRGFEQLVQDYEAVQFLEGIKELLDR